MMIADEIEWRMVRHYTTTTCAHFMHRDEKLGVQWEQISNRKPGSKPRNYFFIDGDPREFLTPQELEDAYNEKFPRDGDDPAHEVIYIKVIKKRLTLSEGNINQNK